MVRKILLTFLISLAIMPISNASVQLTIEEADQILDYFAENIGLTSGTSDVDMTETKNILANVDRETFTNAFNSNFTTKLNITDDYSWENITIVAFASDTSHYANLHFFVSNASASNDFDYLKINKTTSGISFVYWKPETEENGTKLNMVRIQIRNSTYVSVQSSTYYPSVSFYQQSLTDDGIKLNIPSVLACSPSQVVYYNNGTEVTSRFLANYINLVPPIDIPDVPGSGDTSGDTGSGGGSTTTPDYTQDLDDIKNEIADTNNKLDNIQNTISGETEKVIGTLTDKPNFEDKVISSGDIENALGFEFAEDPYSNFWYEIVTGLGGCLTDNVRSIDIEFRGKNYAINLDNFTLQVPQALKFFFSVIFTTLMVWKMVKYWKIIVDNLSSGNIDEVLRMHEEEGITNFF